MILVGGWMMILFSILYVGFTVFIDILIQNQPMLYDLGKQELFKVTAGSKLVRALLSFYAVVPMLLIPSAVGAYYAFIEKHEANMRVGMYFATAGALAVTLSLMMIPSINWYLASYIPALPAQEQPTLIVILKSLHSYFGIYVGDILGLGSLLVWFFISSFVTLRSAVMPRALGITLMILAVITLLVLVLRYAAIMPNIHVNIQVNGIIALWVFIFGIGLISLRKD